jgi:hypothetical protein
MSGLPDGLFSNQKYQFGYILEGPWYGKCWTFYAHLKYFRAILKILWQFGTVLVKFDIFFPFWYVWTEQNPGNPGPCHPKPTGWTSYRRWHFGFGLHFGRISVSWAKFLLWPVFVFYKLDQIKGLILSEETSCIIFLNELSYILDDSKYKIIWSTWLQLGLALLVRFL